jgi:anaerobic selenocysteine-containing dehydrogenase
MDLQINFFCSKDCPDLCGARIDATRPLSAQGAAEAWSDLGFLCRKFKIFAEREIDNAEKSWQLRAGRRSEFGDDLAALDALAALLEEYRDKKILFMRGSGSLGYNMTCWDLLLSQLPHCWGISGGPCDDTGTVAHELDFGCLTNPEVTELEGVDNIILYGKNAGVTSPHLFVYLKKLKKAGKKLIYIDPVKTETAAIADRYIQILPGMDGLLACGLLCALGLEEGQDSDALRLQAGVSVEDFAALLELLQSGKTAHVQGSGLQRQPNGMNAFRWINRLAVKTGSEDLLYWTHSSKRRWHKPQVNFAGQIHVDRIAATLAAGEFDLFICVAGNPAMTYPDSNLWQQALDKTPTIVIGTNSDATSEKASFFLKVGGMFAQKDFMGSYFFHQNYSREKITTELSDAEAVTALAEKLGLEFELKTEELLRHSETFQRNYQTEALELSVPNERKSFRLLTASHANYLNSQTLPGMEKGLQVVHIHETDAAQLGIKNGEDLRISGPCGEFVAEARITEGIAPRTLMCWKNIPMKQGQTNNAIPSSLTDAGEGLDYYGAYVDIEKVAEL